MMRTPPIWAVTALLVCAQSIDAQVLNFSSYLPRDGLPQTQVIALDQDHLGYIWIGTPGGLARYDGQTFLTFTTVDGLRSNRISQIAHTPDGTVVVGMVAGGVCFIEGEDVSCPDDEPRMIGAEVYDLYVEENGDVWAATDIGVAHLRDRRVERVYTTEDGVPANNVFGVWKVADGTYWIGTQAGTAVLAGDRFIPNQLGSAEIPFGVAATSGRRIYTGSREGILVHDEAGSRRIETPDIPEGSRFFDATVGRDGDVWFASWSGVVQIQGDRVRYFGTESGLLSDDVNAVLVDREGIVWFGTERGLAKLVPGPFSLYTDQQGLPSLFVRSLQEDADGRLWAGTFNGPAIFNGDRFVPLPVPTAITDPRVYALAPTPNGSMLAGTRSGLIEYGSRRTRVYGTRDGLPHPYVSTLVRDGDRVWVGTGTGVRVWRDGKLTLPPDTAMTDEFSTSGAVDVRGRLWLGLRRGGVRIWDGTTSRLLGPEEGLTDQTIWMMASDGDGGMWIGSNGDGVFHVSEDLAIRQITIRDGLANDFAWQVLPDGRGNVWVYSSRGLDRMMSDRIVHYDAGLGVVDLEAIANAARVDHRGDLWFAAASGLYRFNVEEDNVDLIPPVVHVQSLTSGGVPHPLTGEELPPGTGVVTFTFAAPAFRNESAIRFQYRLRPIDTVWSDPSSDNRVSFANLGPDVFTFEVRAIDGQGLVTPTPSSVSFTVLPHFWQTAWFLTFAALLGAAALIGTAYFRARSLQAEKAYQESQARMRDILEHSTNLFYAHGSDDKLTYLSPQVHDFLDCSPEEAMTHWYEFLTDNPVNEEGIEASRRALDTGEPQPPYELELVGAKGRKIWVEVREAPMVADNGEVRLVGSLTDITEAKAAHEDRERLERQFHQAQKMEAVGRLAGGIAHDFNNLLTAILGRTQLLREDVAPDGSAADDLDEIAQAAEQGASLVSQLLGLSNRDIAQFERVDLGSVLDEITHLLERILGDKIRLVVTRSSAPAVVHADRTQLAQVIVNLVMNARDAMPDGGRCDVVLGTIHLDEPLVEPGPDSVDPGAYATIEVSDNGRGMPPSLRERIFEPFFTTKPPSDGSGLGLSMVYGVLRQIRGSVHVRTAVGEGTTVRLFLPQAERSDEDVDDATEAVSPLNG